MLKNQAILLLSLIILTTGISNAHTVTIINNTNSPVEARLDYKKITCEHTKHEYIVVNKKYTYNFSGQKTMYTIYIRERSEKIKYYSFIDDTLLITINNTSVLKTSTMGYSRELEFKHNHIFKKMYNEANRLADKYYKKWFINDFKIYNKYVEFCETHLISELNRISKINFKHHEIKQFFSENAKIQFQNGILYFLLHDVIETPVFEDIDPIQAYNAVVDYQILNTPNFPNTAWYYRLLERYSKLMKHYEHKLKTELGKAQNEINNIMFKDLVGTGKESFIFHKSKLIIDEISDKSILLDFKDKIYNSARITQNVKETLLDILNQKISICKDEPFPINKIIDINNKIVDINKYNGNIVLLQFWASWCGYCHKDIEQLRQIIGLLHDEPIKLVMLSIDGNDDEWKKYVNEKSIPGANYCIGKGFFNPILNRLNINSVPTLIVLDKNGKIYSMDYYIESIESTVKELKLLAKRK
ncbi:MAG: TlpA family protein disulfide reductase [Chlorobi bacterium]|nr:TlpA family protein disulfide reductase [Chlorobiota bacterium]